MYSLIAFIILVRKEKDDIIADAYIEKMNYRVFLVPQGYRDSGFLLQFLITP